MPGAIQSRYWLKFYLVEKEAIVDSHSTEKPSTCEIYFYQLIRDQRK